MLRRSGLVLGAACALLLIFSVASGQRPTRGPPRPTTRPTIVPTHSTVQCNELVEYSQIHNNCEVYTNCSGTQCHLEQLLTGSTAKFWVEEKCADPVMVDLSVDGPENSFLNGYRGQFGVGGDGLGVHGPNLSASYGRNASHLTFQAMTFIGGDQAHRLIPEIAIPINPRQCMCASMRQIANIIRFPTPSILNVGISCSPRPDCIGMRCNTTISNVGNYISDVTIDPCGETVRVVVLDSDNATQFDQVTNDSASYPFSIPLGLTSIQASLNIGMVHYNYSMDISVNMEVTASSILPPVPENILPRQKIILDRSNCTNLTYYYTNTTSAPPTTSGAPPTTTGAPPITTGGVPPGTTHSPPLSNCLQINAPNCQITGTNCSGVQCTIQLSSSAAPVVASAEVMERCADPVMVNMAVSPSYQKKFSVSGDGLGSEVNVSGSVVKVEYGRNASHLHFKAIGSTTLIPDVLIPLYPHDCMCQSMTNLSNGFHFDRLSIFGGTTTCSKRPNCDGVTCITVGGYTSDVIIDPCQESVRISLRNTSSSDVIFNHSFPQSAMYPLPVQLSGLTPKLNVNITHSNFSMKLSIKVIIDGVPRDPILLLSPQRIILDRTNCVDPPYYYPSGHPGDTTPSPSASPGGHGGGGGGGGNSPSPSDKHSPPLSLVVGVPFSILAVLAAALVIAIATVLILWRLRKKRRRAYAFQKMTFNEVDDDD